MGSARRPFVGPRVFHPTRFHRGGALPVLAALDLPDHTGAGRDIGVLADDSAGQQGGAGPDRGVVADRDRADVEGVAVDPVPTQIHFGLDRAAVPERQQTGDRRHRVQVDTLADVGAQCARVVDQPRRTGQVLGAAGFGEPLGQPHPQVQPPAARIAAGPHARQQQPRGQHRDAHPAQRSHERDERRRDQPPIHRDRPRHQMQRAGHIVAQRQPRHPLQRRQGGQRHRQHDLRELGQSWRRAHQPLDDVRRLLLLVEEARQ